MRWRSWIWAKVEDGHYWLREHFSFPDRPNRWIHAQFMAALAQDFPATHNEV